MALRGSIGTLIESGVPTPPKPGDVVRTANGREAVYVGPARTVDTSEVVLVPDRPSAEDRVGLGMATALTRAKDLDAWAVLNRLRQLYLDRSK